MSFDSKTLISILRFKVQILWVIAIVISIYFIFYSIWNADRLSYGFSSYYTASKLLIEGERVSDFYDDGWFSAKVEKYVPGVYEIYLVNPPLATLIVLPLAGFSYKTARVAWIFFNLVFLASVLILIMRRMKFEGVWLPLVIIMILSFQPLYANIYYGQVHIFIFCLLVLVWLSYYSENEKLAGIVLGLVFILKTAGLFLWILCAIQKKWRILLWALAAVMILFMVTLPFFGVDGWSSYLNKIINYSSSRTLSVTAYQTIHSFFHHLFEFNQRWNPEPFLNLPWLGKSLTVLFSLLILALTMINAYKFSETNLTFGAFIIAGIILNPASIDYHYVLLLIPVIILFDWLRKNSSPVLWILFIIFFVLISAGLPYTSSKITSGARAIFAYPKLYGALGLWVLFLIAAYRTKFSENRSEKNSGGT
jgi:hypothetical protein